MDWILTLEFMSLLLKQRIEQIMPISIQLSLIKSIRENSLNSWL